MEKERENSGEKQEGAAASSQGLVTITHGVHKLTLNLSKKTVGQVREQLTDPLNIGNVDAYINGEPTKEDVVLKAGDHLEFIKLSGTKGEDFKSALGELRMTKSRKELLEAIEGKEKVTLTSGDHSLAFLSTLKLELPKIFLSASKEAYEEALAEVSILLVLGVLNPMALQYILQSVQRMQKKIFNEFTTPLSKVQNMARSKSE